MEIQNLIDEYVNWLKSSIKFDKIGEYYEITAPYLDHANDYIQFYIKKDGDQILFSDDGVTLSNLAMSGVALSPTRKKILEKILLQYGVSQIGNEIISSSTSNNFALKKHMFIQAILRIDDLFTTNRSRVSSLFLEDIQEFFAEQEIYPSPNIILAGTSGLTHNFDFLFQRTKNKPERLCQAINNPTITNMQTTLFGWSDTKIMRSDNSQLIVLLNDNKPIPIKVEEGFRNYNVKIIEWSERYEQKAIDLLTA